MYVLLVFVFLELLTIGYAQTKCTTPNGQGAQCIPFKQCDVFINAILNNPSEEIKRFLRESHCGTANNQPLVCCGTVANFKPLETKDNIFPHLNSAPIIDETSNTPLILNLTTHKNLHLLPSEPNCGQNFYQDILPQFTTIPEDYTWVALLEYKINEKSTGFNCGGILINSRYVLTAAHCVTGRIVEHAGNLFSVRLGENDLRTHPEDDELYKVVEYYQNIDVEEVIPHPSYNLTGKELNDIALVRLAKPVDFNYTVHTICLPINGETEKHDSSTVVGWQQSTNASLLGKINEVRQIGQTRLISLEECKRKYAPNYELTEQHFCFRDLEESTRCVSDSGGPIVIVFGPPGKRWLQHAYVNGILRVKICYEDEKTPSIYISTKVSYFLDWILDNLKP